MKRIAKSAFWASAVLAALLLIQPASAQAQDCASTCTCSTPCSTGCFIFEWGYATCGDFGYPCCQESAQIGSGDCRTRHWRADLMKCKVHFYDWTRYANLCDNTTSLSFVLTFQDKYPSAQADCPEYDDCPTE